MTFHEPREQCFELLRMQYSQNFLGLHPWTPLGMGLQYLRRKTDTSKKLPDAALGGERKGLIYINFLFDEEV